MRHAVLARKSAVAPAIRTGSCSDAGLRVSPAHDAFEQEAERAAGQVMASGPARAEWSFSRIGVASTLQRKCSCGGSAGAEGECEECRRKRVGAPLVGAHTVQRHSAGNAEPTAVSPSVYEVLRSPGQPLDSATRAFMEPRFGHDFSRVRVHNDARAAESAQMLNAAAFTVGSDVVFGASRYQPNSKMGRSLLAHELTHTIQQGGAFVAAAPLTIGEPGSKSEREAEQAAQRIETRNQYPAHGRQLGHELAPTARESGSANLVQRSALTAIGDFFTKTIPRLFGAENYSPEELAAYLKKIDSGATEGKYDSDNKARAITKAWKLGGSPFVLTAQRKAVMIHEMQQGYTSGDDEQAILELLWRSYDYELAYMFGAGGLNAKSLNSDFSGDNFKRLQDFYETRFAGGMAVLLKGTVKPVGLPVPLGIVLPMLGEVGESGLPVDTLKGGRTEWNEACVLGILCTEDQSVVNQLPRMTVLKTPSVTEYRWEYDGKSWALKTKEHAAFSNARKKMIGFKLEENCAFAAESVVHEVRHQGQPDTWTTVESEKDAYRFEEEWTIERGLPGRSKFRMPKPGGGEQANVPEIEKYVVGHYSGATSTPHEQIVDHKDPNKTVIEKPDGTKYERVSQAGDTHQDYQKTDAELSHAPRVDPKVWACPKSK